MSEHNIAVKPALDDLIAVAAKLPPGPAAWAPIFQHYPALTVEELAQRFRDSAARCLDEADKLQRAAAIPPQVAQALARVITYLDQSGERKDYEASDARRRKKHIWRHIVTLREWLDAIEGDPNG